MIRQDGARFISSEELGWPTPTNEQLIRAAKQKNQELNKKTPEEMKQIIQQVFKK